MDEESNVWRLTCHPKASRKPFQTKRLNFEAQQYANNDECTSIVSAWARYYGPMTRTPQPVWPVMMRRVTLFKYTTHCEIERHPYWHCDDAAGTDNLSSDIFPYAKREWIWFFLFFLLIPENHARTLHAQAIAQPTTTTSNWKRSKIIQ